jgi:hypothetical protein
MSWHENRGISPGVPDLSFVMRGGSFETGWLELKAEEPKNGYIRPKVQTSQIAWIEDHCEHIPVYILIAVADSWHLVHGSYIQELAQKITLDRLGEIDNKIFEKGDFISLAVHLRTLTKRM